MLDQINTILFWIFSFVLFLQAYILIFNRGIPNIRTAPAVRKNIIRLLKNHYAECRHKEIYKIYDLGAGHGDLSRKIAEKFPQADVTGIEISALAAKRAEQKSRHQDNLSIIKTDFMTTDLSKANAIVLFLIDTMMPPLRKKLRKELRPGTLIISNKFPLGGGWKPKQKIDVKTLYINQKTLYVYEA